MNLNYTDTCWTGTELAFAAFLVNEGMVNDGLRIVRQVDDRYRREGLYFDHQEYGGHYYRPMSSWALLHAMLGLELRDGVVTFAPRIPFARGKLLWVTPHGYGHLELSGTVATVRILSGNLKAHRLRFRPNRGDVRRWRLRVPCQTLTARIEDGFLVADLPGGSLSCRTIKKRTT
jgi:hypothetical protein